MELWGKVVNGKTEIHEKSRVSTDSPWTVEMHIFSLSKAGGFRLLRGGDVILDLKDEKEFNQVGGEKNPTSPGKRAESGRNGLLGSGRSMQCAGLGSSRARPTMVRDEPGEAAGGLVATDTPSVCDTSRLYSVGRGHQILALPFS